MDRLDEQLKAAIARRAKQGDGPAPEPEPDKDKAK
jgi:hypothetical protein